MDKITQLICNKNKISYVIFDENYKTVEFNDHIVEISEDFFVLKIGGDVRDVMWELVGIEDEISMLFKAKDKKISFPMILKNNIYYDLDIETYVDEENAKLFIAYLLQKPKESIGYINMIKEINKKTLIYEHKNKHNTENYYELINKRLLSFNVDLDGIILSVNNVFAYFFDLADCEIIGKHFSYYFKARDLSLAKENSIIFNATNIKGEIISFHADIIPVAKDGYVYENIMICQDITYLKQIEKKLEYAAGHDSLTGLPNRSQLLNKMDIIINKNNELSPKFSICFIDIDKFKSINDNYGHHAGDMLLKHITKVLSDFIRKDDLVARIGGDEFIILFDSLSDDNSIRTMLSRLSKLAQNQSLIYTKEDVIEFNFSLGLASYPKDASNIQDLIKVADKSMYLNKRR